ncbi:MAG: fructose-specific PTS transporter subunit EIIC [Enterococcus avium]|jgi:fructose PTS system EIIBC or EIIC component|uniref:fructose-specific PTS transporter subunit EIIC n=1 Tax=Enterococcus raffinosus TaxID=71452 RepID=UPI001C125022|nr:fructose-specific PTS transporter subunit EIIC [Enterococcus raffinosus]MBS6070231.1 fructose-specific PTS transporter subunit EIIC [Enterococcus avium]MBU5363398.1 fructose-specific PTS transporter subunit EIIC [Enterococcus raffinosus]
MQLEALTNPGLIFLQETFQSKAEVFESVGEQLVQQGVVTNKARFIEALYQREKESPTGLENGIAIPHGKSTSINEAAFAIIRLKKPIQDWESLDPANQVSLIFLLAVPEKNASDLHVELLAQLSRRLMNAEFVEAIKQAKTEKEVLQILSRKASQADQKVNSNNGIILGVTACATGIAHTYMAAEALEKAGQELGYRVIVEKQGANGIEDRPTKQEIQSAKGLILATDVEPQNMSIYEGVPFIKTKVAEPIKNAADLIERVVEQPVGRYRASSQNTETQEKGSIGSEMYQALMSGISYMIPIVVGAGLMTAIPQIGGLFLGVESGTIGDAINATSSNSAISFLYYLNQFGGFIFSLMYPVLSAFMANAIAGKVGMTAGFIGGGLAGGMMYGLTGIEGRTASGFLGAIAIGYVAGYFCKFLNTKIHLSKNIQSLKPMLIIPLLSILVVYVLNMLIFEPIGGGLNNLLFDVISKSSGTYVVAIVIAMATAFDMGGPVNKAAFAVTLALATNESFPMTANILGCIIPPLGIGMSVILNQYIFKKNIFDESLEAAGYTSFISGIIGISEGAIPFALKNPLITIPLNLVGSALAAVLATLFGVEIWFPIPQFWGWPLVQGLPMYLVSLAAGILFVALGNIFIREYLFNKKVKQVGNNDKRVRS